MSIKSIRLLHRMIVGTATAMLAAVLSLSANATPIYDGPGNNGGETTVNGINNFGDVLGFSSDNATTPTLFTNFIRNANGKFNTLNVGADPLAMANGINDSRTVVGAASNGTAFTLSGGTLTTLPTVNSRQLLKRHSA